MVLILHESLSDAVVLKFIRQYFSLAIGMGRSVFNVLSEWIFAALELTNCIAFELLF